MKRIHSLLALVLSLAIGLILLTPMEVLSEQTSGGADDGIAGLYEGLPLPVSYDTKVERSARADAEGILRNISCNFVSSANTVMMIEADFLIYDGNLSEDDWSAFSAKFEENALAFIKNEWRGDEGQLPKQLSQEIEAKNGHQDIALSTLKVTHPYYAELASGASGSAVTRLQKRLNDLGFMEGAIDGHFGPKTKAAVEAVQTYLRAIEQRVIDENAPAADETEETGEVEDAEAIEPETAVDGIAQIKLQALLFSDRFPDNYKSPEADSLIVQRIQRRLRSMNYMLGTADGLTGANTTRGLLLFQSENDLPETGNPDEDTLSLLFSDSAKSAEYALLGVGSSGDDVKKLQSRLIELGFMTGSADGSFGESTRLGVENLQAYVREQEIIALQREQVVPAMKTLSSEAEPEEAPDIEIDEGLIKTQINGIADTLLLRAFYGDSFKAIPSGIQKGDQGLDVMRVQRRLNQLGYIYGGVDGSFGSGTSDAITKFQIQNGVNRSGNADRETLTVLLSSSAKKAAKPYVLKISVDKQRVYAYAMDNNGEYTKLVRTMVCSTGLKATPTITGTFQSTTGPGARWHYFKKFDCWAQYAYYIQGDYMIHSVLYGTKNGPVTQSSVNNLGKRASHGCVRLSVEDAKWVYNNCPKGTKIVVY